MYESFDTQHFISSDGHKLMFMEPDRLPFCTVRIETDTGSGTGFFFSFAQEGFGHIPCIVTNKHVIQGASEGDMHFHVKKPNEELQLGNHVAMHFTDFESLWIRHPDDEVDLAVFPIADVLEQIKQGDLEPFLCLIQTSAIADDVFIANRSAIEDIYMVGYPRGLWDYKNNLPIVRKGITASPLYAHFEGKREFMIDCACFPGSSGSPVFVHVRKEIFEPDGRLLTTLQTLRLAGILYAGPLFTAMGTIETRPIPTSSVPFAITPIMMNLGQCIKADRLLWFDEHLSTTLAEIEFRGFP